MYPAANVREHFIVSFIDDYKNVRNNYKFLRLKEFKESDYEAIGKSFSKSAKNNGITVQTCFEERNLVEYGFIQADCLGKELAERLTGKTKFKKWKARSGGKCNCVEMADIGAYNTCKHFWKYFYKNFLFISPVFSLSANYFPRAICLYKAILR